MIELEAGRKLHKRIKYQGLDISVENRKGSVRTGTDPNWGPWRTKMRHDYGYVKGSKGFDGGGVDAFVGPYPDAKMAYVVHIMKLPNFKKFDEDKCMLGFHSAREAKKAFMQHYNDPGFYGGMDVVPMPDFKKKVLRTAQTGPVKIEANTGEPQVYDGGMAHIEPKPSVHPPSLKNPQRVPSPNDPREKDDRFGDVTRKNDQATRAMRTRLTQNLGTDAKKTGLITTQVGGFPSGGVGGFG